MIVRKTSALYQVLRAVCYSLGPICPLWVTNTRVGDDLVSFVYVGFRKPQ